jgi:hypothetical protein
MSDLTWFDKLHHIRFSMLLLTLEKWFSVFIVCFLVLAGIAPIWLSFSVFVLFLLYLHFHANHYELVQGAGLPVVRAVLRF